jgi:hypothetical protein
METAVYYHISFTDVKIPCQADFKITIYETYKIEWFNLSICKVKRYLLVESFMQQRNDWDSLNDSIGQHCNNIYRESSGLHISSRGKYSIVGLTAKLHHTARHGYRDSEFFYFSLKELNNCAADLTQNYLSF